MCDSRLIDQNRIQKMDRDAGMFRTSQHQLECKIHQRADADCHVTLTTDFALPLSTARDSMRTRRSVSAAGRNGKRELWRSLHT